MALSILYGQRHSRELRSAGEIADQSRLPLVFCDASSALDPIFRDAQSSQVGRQLPVPKGHYEAESMRATLVPNRNMLLISIAGALAESIGASLVAYAAHAGDHAIYPDCRPHFLEACDETLQRATESRVRLAAPFLRMAKAQIVTRGKELGVPFELTWSCYKGGRLHCGKCGTCVERREAFQVAGVLDPTEYEA